jgi:hypothetical protein
VRTGSNLVGQPNDVRVGGEIELLANERLVDGGMSNGTVTVACRRQRPHEPQGDPRVDRILRGQAAPPGDRRHVIAAGLRARCTPVEGRLAVVLEGAPLPLHPPLEFGGTRQIEPIQERAGVERRRAVVVARTEGLLELRDVTR